MNIQSITAKVNAWLADPANEDKIAEAAALEIVKVSIPAIVASEKIDTAPSQESHPRPKPEDNADGPRHPGPAPGA